MGLLDDLINQQFGVKTRAYVNPEISVVGVSATKILSRNNNRLAFIIVNLSSNAMYLLPEDTPTASKGIVLAANGGTYTGIWKEDLHLVGYQWNILSAGVTSAVLSVEVVGYGKI